MRAKACETSYAVAANDSMPAVHKNFSSNEPKKVASFSKKSLTISAAGRFRFFGQSLPHEAARGASFYDSKSILGWSRSGAV
jgi:hypothetical protein